jgi:hypothetical protein
MKLLLRNLSVVTAGSAVVWLGSVALTDRAKAQAPAGKEKTAGEVFKAVNTSTLKGLTVSDFIGAMGVMAAALGYDCSDCHPGAGSDKADWVFDTPKKITARKMTEMVAVINRQNFGGVQAVTCYTCHHGRDLPSTTIALDTLYGPPPEDKRDVITPGQGVPSAAQLLDKYIQALGGAQRLAGLTSYIATGTSTGYEGLGGGGSFQIFAKAPDMKTTQIIFKDHPERGDSTRVYNGKQGWVKQPRAFVPNMELTGNQLAAARFDAQMAFAGQIKTLFNNWRVGAPDTIGDKEVYVVQGGTANGVLATLYFDKDSGLLLRIVSYTPSPIGRISTQSDFGDYRDVNGIKFPFTYTFSWLDGRDSFKLTGVQVNVPIPADKFTRPQ